MGWRRKHALLVRLRRHCHMLWRNPCRQIRNWCSRSETGCLSAPKLGRTGSEISFQGVENIPAFPFRELGTFGRCLDVACVLDHRSHWLDHHAHYQSSWCHLRSTPEGPRSSVLRPPAHAPVFPTTNTRVISSRFSTASSLTGIANPVWPNNRKLRKNGGNGGGGHHLPLFVNTERQPLGGHENALVGRVEFKFQHRTPP